MVTFKHPFIKTLQKVGREGAYLNIIKAIYEKPTNNIILSDEELKIISAMTRNHEVVGSTPGLAQWVGDLALL